MTGEPLPPLLSFLVIGGLIVAGWTALISLMMCAYEVIL
jgi:hypothetical protein